MNKIDAAKAVEGLIRKHGSLRKVEKVTGISHATLCRTANGELPSDRTLEALEKATVATGV